MAEQSGEFDYDKTLEKYTRTDSNGCTLVTRMADNIVKKYGGVYQADMDDFYSVAYETLWMAAKDFDESLNIEFPKWLHSCIERKVMTMMTARNRQKRVKWEDKVFINAKISYESETTIEEVLKAPELEETECTAFDKYYDSLSSRQKKIADLIMLGMTGDEICTALSMTKRRYEILLNDMGSTERWYQYKLDRIFD